ncbi:hypothetical protein ACQ4LE_009029 [Meloidogyne hapla]|uniref:CCHC-type domain-containing protein n=1 Tax=Meloidogyne hapla TaxID=6305 RepID=A0A1I8BNE4_MELHA
MNNSKCSACLRFIRRSEDDGYIAYNSCPFCGANEEVNDVKELNLQHLNLKDKVKKEPEMDVYMAYNELNPDRYGGNVFSWRGRSGEGGFYEDYRRGDDHRGESVDWRGRRECYECGRSGHLKKDCPNIRCLRCKLIGHRVRDCPAHKLAPKCFSCHEHGHEGWCCPKSIGGGSTLRGDGKKHCYRCLQTNHLASSCPMSSSYLNFVRKLPSSRRTWIDVEIVDGLPRGRVVPIEKGRGRSGRIEKSKGHRHSDRHEDEVRRHRY